MDNSPDGTGKTPYKLSGKTSTSSPTLRANRIIGWNDEHFFIGHDGNEGPDAAVGCVR
jgi:hypothetical protein